MRLRATTVLGENTLPILRGLTDRLRADGVDIVIDTDVAPGEADLLFACGLLTRILVEEGADLTVVAAPIFPGESSAVYRSMLIGRAGDEPPDLETLSRRRLAVNEYGSWSGWHGYCRHLRVHGLTPNRRRVETGSHRASMQAVCEGVADVAAIDSSVWAFQADGVHRDGLTVVATTDDWPAPPLSVATRIDPTMRARIVAGIIGGADFVPSSTGAYDSMLDELD